MAKKKKVISAETAANAFLRHDEERFDEWYNQAINKVNEVINAHMDEARMFTVKIALPDANDSTNASWCHRMASTLADEGWNCKCNVWSDEDTGDKFMVVDMSCMSYTFGS